jgi:DNA mismatch repair protein MutS
LGALRDSSVSITKIKSLIAGVDCALLKSILADLDDFADIRKKLSDALVDEPPLSSKEGGIIRKGFNTELDEFKLIQTEGKKWISDLESSEKKKTGINSLKVGYNRVFGYYIEVTSANLTLTPENYIRKQTLTNAERFITPELKVFEGLMFFAPLRRLHQDMDT